MTKEQLCSYRALVIDMQRHAARIREISCEIDAMAADIITDDAVVYSMYQLVQLREHHRQQMMQCDINMRAVENAIESLPDTRYRAIMSMRYLDGITSWEKIAEAVGVTPRHAQRMHGYALGILDD